VPTQLHQLVPYASLCLIDATLHANRGTLLDCTKDVPETHHFLLRQQVLDPSSGVALPQGSRGGRFTFRITRCALSNWPCNLQLNRSEGQSRPEGCHVVYCTAGACKHGHDVGASRCADVSHCTLVRELTTGSHTTSLVDKINLQAGLILQRFPHQCCNDKALGYGASVCGQTLCSSAPPAQSYNVSPCCRQHERHSREWRRVDEWPSISGTHTDSGWT
jgi:hypothetical protein